MAIDYFDYLWPATWGIPSSLERQDFFGWTVGSYSYQLKMCIDTAFLCTKIQILCAQHAKWQPVWHSLGWNFHFDLTRPKTHRLVDSYHLPKLIFTTRKNSGFFKGHDSSRKISWQTSGKSWHICLFRASAPHFVCGWLDIIHHVRTPRM